MQTCKSNTRAGAACRAPAGPEGFCFLHANPDRAKALGRLGGRKNRRSAIDLDVPDDMSAAGLCKVTGQAMRLLLSGELGAREASALAQLCNSMFRIFPTVDLESRLTILEEQVAAGRRGVEEEGGIVPDGVSTGSPMDRTNVAETYVAIEGEQSTGSNDVTVEPEEGDERLIDEPEHEA